MGIRKFCQPGAAPFADVLYLQRSQLVIRVAPGQQPLTVKEQRLESYRQPAEATLIDITTPWERHTLDQV
jgi:hypothetical protein